MCEDCGCGDTNLVPVAVHERILSKNDAQARHNREHFVEAGVLAINLMGSPGSGKTALLEATAKFSKGRLALGAVSGDLATDNDAQRLQKAGIPSEAITTGNACHLDAEMVHHALHHLAWRETDVFVIENVGNLVCPAVYDLGQAANVVALAVTEGEDKPLKYPVMFRGADLVVLTKVDLVPHLDVSMAAIKDALARVMPKPNVIEVSAKTGAGIEQWVAWLEAHRPKKPAHPHSHSHSHDHDHHHGHSHGHRR
ncbi:MAG: hydrogenase nickel incorporation protein HypB [Myxococcaceae bacterium]